MELFFGFLKARAKPAPKNINATYKTVKMIYEIELSNEYANQEFDIDIPGAVVNIHVLLQTNENNALLMSVFVNNELLGWPFTCRPNEFVLPYSYMQSILGGNFLFETVSDNYPNFENFGDECKLNFVTLDEIK